MPDKRGTDNRGSTVIHMSDSFSRKNFFSYLINALNYLHFTMLAGNWFQIFGPMYHIDCLDTVFLYDMAII